MIAPSSSFTQSVGWYSSRWRLVFSMRISKKFQKIFAAATSARRMVIVGSSWGRALRICSYPHISSQHSLISSTRASSFAAFADSLRALMSLVAAASGSAGRAYMSA
jgi:hypothetical protein